MAKFHLTADVVFRTVGKLCWMSEGVFERPPVTKNVLVQLLSEYEYGSASMLENQVTEFLNTLIEHGQIDMSDDGHQFHMTWAFNKRRYIYPWPPTYRGPPINAVAPKVNRPLMDPQPRPPNPVPLPEASTASMVGSGSASLAEVPEFKTLIVVKAVNPSERDDAHSTPALAMYPSIAGAKYKLTAEVIFRCVGGMWARQEGKEEDDSYPVTKELLILKLSAFDYGKDLHALERQVNKVLPLLTKSGKLSIGRDGQLRIPPAFYQPRYLCPMLPIYHGPAINSESLTPPVKKGTSVRKSDFSKTKGQ